jgi:hypothetical protein
VLASSHTMLSLTYTHGFKIGRLLDIYFFIDAAIEKYTLDIHLIELYVVGTSIG